MTSGESRDTTDPWDRLVLGACFLIFVGYLVQSVSPLRLTPDAVAYLNRAAALADARDIDFGHSAPGYPVMLAIVDRLGGLTSAKIILLNCIFLAVGLVAFVGIAHIRYPRFRSTATVACLATLLSYITIKHATLPLSDVAFFGTSCASLYCMESSAFGSTRRRVAMLAVAAILAGIAFETRYIGLALLPPLAIAFYSVITPSGLSLSRAHVKGLAAGLLVVAGTSIVLLRDRGFLRVLNLPRTMASGVEGERYFTFYSRPYELGVTAMNIPESRLSGHMNVVMVAIGIVVLAALVSVIHRRALQSPSAAYVVCYTIILFTWPWMDPRLWLPIIPFLAADAIRVFKPGRKKWVRMAGIAYGGWFALSGIAALAYSTRISFAGPSFPQLYGNGSWKSAYAEAVGPEPPHGTWGTTVSVIRRFGFGETPAH